MHKNLLNNQGGDRATGYAMSTKLVHLPEGLLCTWLNVQRQNRWCLAAHDSEAILQQGTLGEARKDNHCGAALARAPDGTVHAVLGGHHSALDHYRLDSTDEGIWHQVARIDVEATYPSLVCDRNSALHLVFRCRREPRWTLDYSTFRDGTWNAPRPLVVAQKPGYVYWTNGLAVGQARDPHDRLHLVFANVRVQPDGTLYYGASHLSSDDGGKTWSGLDSDPIGSLPASVEQLALLHRHESPDRIASATWLRAHAEPGPANREYMQMLLSNVVVDPGGTPHVVCHNGIDGTAELWSRTSTGWRARPLTTAALSGAPGFRIHMQSSLSCDQTGTLYAALMIEPAAGPIWGPNGTRVVRLRIPPVGSEIDVGPICAPDEAVAQWLPAQEQPGSAPLDHEPALLYTRGANAGGFGANVNQTATQVWLARSHG